MLLLLSCQFKLLLISWLTLLKLPIFLQLPLTLVPGDWSELFPKLKPELGTEEKDEDKEEAKVIEVVKFIIMVEVDLEELFQTINILLKNWQSFF